jgi:predicted RNase H-like HicB family nuclease
MVIPMLTEYIQKAMDKAQYEMIQDDDPFYGEIPELRGVWASAKTLEDCRRQLAQALEDWLFFSIARGMPIPPMDGTRIELPQPITD